MKDRFIYRAELKIYQKFIMQCKYNRFSYFYPALVDTNQNGYIIQETTPCKLNVDNIISIIIMNYFI